MDRHDKARDYTNHINATTLLFCVTKSMSTNFCEVCGIDVSPTTDLRRFDKLFCSPEHMNQYMIAREKKQDLGEEYRGRPEQKKEKGWRRFLRDIARGCC